jgi:hypothetical protein
MELEFDIFVGKINRWIVQNNDFLKDENTKTKRVLKATVVSVFTPRSCRGWAYEDSFDVLKF